MSAYTVTVGGQTLSVVLIRRVGNTLTLTINEREHTVQLNSSHPPPPSTITVEALPRDRRQKTASSSKGALPPEVRAPLPGIISDVKVREGDTVSAGGTLVVIEAMKMENPIKAPADLRVTKVLVRKGQEITHGLPLLSVEPLS
jgi:biotin carboxyl carrier protein